LSLTQKLGKKGRFAKVSKMIEPGTPEAPEEEKKE
jgi:hypothetical protein